jgi:hypothetical protein
MENYCGQHGEFFGYDCPECEALADRAAMWAEEDERDDPGLFAVRDELEAEDDEPYEGPFYDDDPYQYGGDEPYGYEYDYEPEYEYEMDW